VLQVADRERVLNQAEPVLKLGDPILCRHRDLLVVSPLVSSARSCRQPARVVSPLGGPAARR
jgi:hypothetical protein